MKKYFINIDRSTIKRNKDGGQTRTIVPESAVVTYVVPEMPDVEYEKISSIPTSHIN